MKHSGPDTALFTNTRGMDTECVLQFVYSMCGVTDILFVTCQCLCWKTEATKQQEGPTLYQSGPQPPLLSRRQSLETQYLTHRLQVRWCNLIYIKWTRVSTLTTPLSLLNIQSCWTSWTNCSVLSFWRILRCRGIASTPSRAPPLK